MSTTLASENIQSHATNFVACIRDVVREELASAQANESAMDTEALRSQIREDLRRDILASTSSEDNDPIKACLANAETLFASEEWTRQVNQMIQEALKGVLPSMVKRFRSEMEQAVSELPSSSGAGTPSDLQSVINSTEMKEMLEDRFRQMLLYLKTEVIPKAVKQE